MSHSPLGTVQASKARLGLSGPYGALVLVAVAGMLIGLLIGYSASETPLSKLPSPPSMSQCVAETSSLFSQNGAPASEAFRDARDHCYSVIQSHDLFNDSAIRKLNFFQQYRANGILMWMVVVVTFSGVVLAGLQLGASYQLAAAGRTTPHEHDSELIWKHDQIVLKSSITGLFILLISFCFFLVFVFYVYKLESPTDRNNSIPPLVPNAPMGGLGPPPDLRKP